MRKRILFISPSRPFLDHVCRHWTDLYAVHARQPADLLRLAAPVLAHEMSQASAVLVDWTAEAAPVLASVGTLAAEYQVPVFALCQPVETDHVAALVLGADEVLVWPCQPMLVEAHLVAFYRRMQSGGRVPAVGWPSPGGDSGAPGVPDPPAPVDVVPGEGRPSDEGDLSAPPVPAVQAPEILQVGPLRLDQAACVCYAAGARVGLTRLEFNLLWFFLSQPGVCHRREQILERLWGIDFETGTNIVDARVYSLRSKLKRSGLPELICTVRGVGYRLEIPPAWLGEGVHHHEVPPSARLWGGKPREMTGR